MRRIPLLARLMVPACLLAIGTPAFAQNADPQIVVVPDAPKNPRLPHPVYEGARITLKAMLRNANCNSGYSVRWDVDRDGEYNDDTERVVTRVGSSVYDIGRTFTVPTVGGDTSLPINVRVVNRCNGAQSFATYRLFVYDWAPSNDPRQWTAEQIEIMGKVALGEALWYMHRGAIEHNGSGGSIMARHRSNGRWVEGTALAVWAFSINGHLPAYDPDDINVLNFRGYLTLPNGWLDANRARFESSPYSETAMRYLNRVINQGTGSQNVDAAAEDNTCGFQNNGNARNCNPIAGTDNRRGAYTGGTSNNTYRQGIYTGAIPPTLPSLAGTQLQVGGLAGNTYEWFAQELTDWLAYMQIDGGCGKGGWYYTAQNGSPSCGRMDASTAQWGYIGLESAEVAGGPYGVIVSNTHKYKLAYNIVRNQRSGGTAYRTGSGSHAPNTQLTGGAFVAARWLGIHRFDPNDGSRPFPQSSEYTAGQMRQAFDRYVQFTANNWEVDNGDWWGAKRFWRGGTFANGGSYLCGNTNSVYRWGNNAECGNLYAIYSHQKGYRTGEPAQGNIGGHDWQREFPTYVVRSQHRDTGNYGTFGMIQDCGRANSIVCWAGQSFGTPVGALILTPTIFNPKPVAIATAEPTTVVEGCAGGNNGEVDFDHSGSFHPNPEERIIAFQWDVDASNGLWWDTGAPADFNGGANTLDDVFDYRYARRGNYTATLRVVGSGGQTKTATVVIQVNGTANKPPSAADGGPYVIEVGDDLVLRGSAADSNLGCGDSLDVDWDLDGDGQFDDAGEADATVGWAALQNLARGQAINIGLRVRDSAGLTATASTTLTIYPREPVARLDINPNPAGCRQLVTFDGNQSRHPNPNRRIVSYAWDINGDGSSDGGGAVFNSSYDRFDSYDVTLTVTDDGGRTAVARDTVAVDQGNGKPTARLPELNYSVLENQDLELDGRGSSDPNTDCGDGIVEYAFDIDGDGGFDGPHDIRGQQARVVIPWATLVDAMDWPADRQTGLPDNRVTLRVTDTFGLFHSTTAKVRIYRARPEAEFTQTPEPGYINQVSGRADVTLDARDSFSPIPDGSIQRYQWDVDGDGVFGDLDEQAVVVWRLAFDNVPQPGQEVSRAVTLRVTDSAGQTATVTRDVTFATGPVAPTADADPADPPETGYHILEGDGVTLSALQTSDPNIADSDDYIRFYRWALDEEDADGNIQWDVVLEDRDADGEEAIVEVELAALRAAGIDGPGDYPIVLEVEDSTGRTDRDTSVIHVYAREPNVVLVANPNPSACRQRINLDASQSSHPHPGVDVLDYEWDFDGDGEYDDGVGAQTSFTPESFTFEGALTLAVRVTDSAGDSATASVDVPVNVGNRGPAVDLGGPYVIGVGDGVRFDASDTADPDADCGDAVVRYAWDLNADGADDRAGADLSALALTWAELEDLGIGRQGQHSVRLTATDRFGTTGQAAVVLEIVNGPTAVAELDPARAGCNALVTFDGSRSFTDGPDGADFEIVQWSWDFDGDGESDAEGRSVQRNAVGFDQVPVTLTVTDAGGRSHSVDTVLEIAIDNVPPVADAGGPYTTGPVGGGQFAGVDLDARGSTDPNAPCDTIERYEWDTDGDGLYGAADNNGAGGLQGSDYVGAVVRDYTSPAWQVGLSQLVRVRACDRAGVCSAPDEAEIEVLNTAPPVGEIVSPRVGDCIAEAQTDVRVRVRDADGDRVTAVLLADGNEIGRAEVQTRADNQAVDHVFQVNAGAIAEGGRNLEVVFTDTDGAEGRADAGGRVTFDRTAPTVTIANNLAEGVCYNPGAVPERRITVQDAIDPGPAVDEALASDTCQRTLTVTATDACGNEGRATRTYLIAQAVRLEIDGPDDGALVAQATYDWSVVGPQACAGRITAALNQDGGAAGVYAAGTPIEAPGSYTLRVDAPDCAGDVTSTLRAFRVNGPPNADAVPDGHPQADPAAVVPAYIVDEGDVLEVDGSGSTPPEAGDSIQAWAWDLDDDGQYETEGRIARFPTQEDGVFTARLRVTDSLGATDDEAFEVTVIDVDPTADAGGPYTVRQGERFVLDGSGSRAGSAADQITRYIWTLPDGTVLADGAGAEQPEVAFDVDQTTEVRLEVRDEDSIARDAVQVTVRDVSPTINGVDLPEAAFELEHIRVTVDADAGAERDPIIAYEWDFDGDGEADVVSPDPTVNYQYDQPGEYTAVLRVRDPDSTTTAEFAIDVRAITFTDLLELARERGEAVLDDPEAPARARSAIEARNQTPFAALVERGLWAERHGYRQNTLVALDEISFRIYRSQQAGGAFGDYLWVLSRVVLRMLDAKYDAAEQIDIPNAALTLADDSLRFATAAMDEAHSQFENVEYRDRSMSADEAFVARDFYSVALEAWFWLEEAVDPNQDYNGFPVPTNGTVARRVQDSEPINSDLGVALGRLADALQSYVALGGDDVGPGRAQVAAAQADLARIQALVALPVWCGDVPEGEDPECIDDRQSLDLQLGLMDLIANLFAAADRGVYVRNWQNLLTTAVKFRVELALLRIEQVCGPFQPLTLAGREQQRILLDLVEDGQNELALQFYVAPDRRCLVVREYNECLVPAIPDNAAVEYPENCEPGDPFIDDNPDGGDGGGGDPDGPVFLGDRPIPLPAPFSDILMLRDIIRAFNDLVDVADPEELEAQFPGRTFEDFDVIPDGEFDINDVDLAILMFITDPADDDGDGLDGVIENRCLLPGGLRLDPRNPETTGVPDVELDCDGDRIPNGVEIEMYMNPVEAADFDLDYDNDGLSNGLEYQNGLDHMDPDDGAADADGDGVSNAHEINAGMDMNNGADAGADFDLDGISNGDEATWGLDPRNPADADADPDGDGMSSRNEIARGRDPLRADCANDPAEIDGRNDGVDEATVVEIDRQASIDNGTLCNSAAADDADFYRFEVEDEDMRLAIALEHPAGVDLNLRLFNAANGVQVADSSTDLQRELIAIPRGQLQPGAYAVRVWSPDGDEADYTLDITLLPAEAPCLPDVYEGQAGNDRPNQSAPLSVPARFGDAWVCTAERQAGDWYRLGLTDRDLTVHITYTRADALMTLSANTERNGNIDAYEESVEVQSSVQCINVEATGNPTDVFVNVKAETIFSDGDDRADYVMQVVETDLDAAPRGACDELSNGLFDFIEWPTLSP